jgi:hypothetical protein
MDTIQAMAKFIEWAMQEGPWDGLGLDGGEIQDKAEELGLIVRSPRRKDWFILAPEVSAALSNGER